MRRLLAVLVLTLLAACSGDDWADRGRVTPESAPTTADPRFETVGIVGDSITVGAEAAIVIVVEGMGVDDVAVDALSGRRMTTGPDPGVQAVGRVVAEDPDLWVVALGTNDVANLTGPEEYGAAIDQLLAVIPADAPLVWIDVYLAMWPEESAEFNETLRDRLADRGHATAVDWASIAAADGVLGDGVHPTDSGNLRFAAAIAGGIANWES